MNLPDRLPADNIRDQAIDVGMSEWWNEKQHPEYPHAVEKAITAAVDFAMASTFDEPAPAPRHIQFTVDWPDANDVAAPCGRSYGTDPERVAHLIKVWSGLDTTWEEVQ